MIRRSLTTLSLLALAAAPLAAQGAAADPTHKVAGGALPAGWMGRTDSPTDKLTDAKFVAMGSGYHVTSGPAAIYWNPKTNMTGPFVASTTLTQTKAPTHPEYGLLRFDPWRIELWNVKELFAGTPPTVWRAPAH